MDARILTRIGARLESYVGPADRDLFPGAVVLVERGGVVAYRMAFGHAQTHAEAGAVATPRPMRFDTIFDVASLTKVCAAAPVLMHLVAGNVLHLDSLVSTLLPEFHGPGKEAVTVRALLMHRAGLWEWWPLYADASTSTEAISVAARLPLRYAPNAGRHYSDLGLILAGAIAETLTGERLDVLARRFVLEAPGLGDTCFKPPATLRPRIAATSTGDRYEQEMLATGEPYPTGRRPEDFDGWRKQTLVGEVEDGNAHHAFGGVAGHAGLFSTADDIARLMRMLIECAAGRSSWLPHDVARAFIGNRRGSEPLVFWSDRRAEVGLGRGGVGHSGFTGAQLFIDSAMDLVVVMLTNRTHRRQLPYPSVLPAWKEVLRICFEAAGDRGGSSGS